MKSGKKEAQPDENKKRGEEPKANVSPYLPTLSAHVSIPLPTLRHSRQTQGKKKRKNGKEVPQTAKIRIQAGDVSGGY